MTEALTVASLDQDFLERTRDQIIHECIGNQQREGSGHPHAYLVAGAPGSGKSRIAELAMERIRGSGQLPVHVDSDKLRVFHPEYSRVSMKSTENAFLLTQPYVSIWADCLRDEAISRKLDLVLEGVFKTAQNTRSLCEMLGSKGYRRLALVKLMPRVLSLLQIELRYERQLIGKGLREAVPRRVSASAHDVGYNAVPRFLELVESERLIDYVQIYDHENALFHCLPIKSNDQSASKIVKEARNKGINSDMRRAAELLSKQIVNMRQQRHAAITPEPGSALEAALQEIADWS